jgi:hypothetical protein
MDNEKLIEDLKKQLRILITKSYKDRKSELEKDLNLFLETSKEKLERWVTLYASAALTEEEFEWLLKSQLDLLVLKALQNTGISKIRLNAIKNNIIKMILKVILEFVLPRI